MPDYGISMPMLQTPAGRFPEFAKLADDAGFNTLWDYEFYRNPLITLARAADATEDIKLATGISQAFTRSPFELANAAVDVDEVSGGRMVLGLAPGGADFIEAFHSGSGAKPVARMREYIDVVRMTWDYLGNDAPADMSYKGEHYWFQGLPLNPWGGRELVRERIPIYLAAMRPKMLELVGEKCDGTLGYVQTPEFTDGWVRPNVAKGAEGAGRDVSEIDIASLVVCCVSDDRDEAWHRARIQVGMYVAYPVGDPSIQFHGMEEHQLKIRQAMMTGGIAAIEGATSDELVELYAICGTPDEARRQAERYQRSIDNVVLHCPYVPPLSPDETTDAFEQIVRVFGE